MASITITPVGLGASISGLESLRRASRTPMMQMLGAEQVANIRDRVEQRKSHTDATYSASKRAQRDGGTTLEDTGAMLAAMRASNWTESSVTVGFGSALEMKKAIWNQEGTRGFTVARGKAFPITESGGSKKVIAWSRKKSATPPRPFFGVSPNDAAKLMTKANDAFLKIIEKAGLKHG